VAAITCPIGDPALGKHPHQIAIGVAADLVRGHGATEGTRDDARTAS
jgi:xanthine dehydrogenase accessory factor